MERPLLRPSRSSGWTMSSFWPTRDAFFIVQTTLPVTRPSSTLFLSRGGEVGFVQRVDMHFVDDANNRGVHGPVLAFGGHARRTASHYQHCLAKPGIDRVHGDEVTGFVGAFRRNRFDDEEVLAFET